MKKILYIFCLIFLSQLAKAETYGNEWISYGTTYYKFKVAQTSLYRISQSTLIGLGLPASQLRSADFKLIRNGVEVPLYISTTGLLTPSDYIEFYGEKNDGKPDSLLYKTKNNQPNDRYSIYTDSATFYLTLAPFSINKRIIQEPNDVSVVPAKEEYCYKTLYNPTRGGFRGFPSSPFYSELYNSDFDMGEGNIDFQFKDQLQLTNFFMTRSVKKDGANAYLFISLIKPEGFQRINFKLNGFDTTLSSNIQEKSDHFLTIRSNDIVSNQPIFMTPANSITYRVGQLILKYPREINFDNLSKYEFGINKNSEVYFEVRNFDTKSTTPILYDLKNNKRYLAVVDSLVKFHLDFTLLGKDSLYLSAQTTTEIPFINSIKSVVFNSPPVQGDYLIISNKNLKTSSNGTDYLEQYKNYRRSTQGGNFNANIYYYDELTDQFGYGISQHALAIRNFVNYAVDKFTQKPELAFIIGKGFEYVYTSANPSVIPRSLVPTYGEPASDNLLMARNATLNYPQIGVGRLDAFNGDDIKGYLEKVKEYETNLNDTFNLAETPFNKMWMKNVLHLGGGNNNNEQQLFRSYLEYIYKPIIEGPLFGGKVSSLYKNSTDPIQIAQNIFLDSIINTGVSLITFFGHSATTTLDFNLEPEHFDNKGKYHLMLSNGCFVGSIFTDVPHSSSYSDRFVLTPNKAAIGYIAPTTYAVSSSLNNYSSKFYENFSTNMYNDYIGNILKETSKSLALNGFELNPQIGEQMIFHGDPGLRINTHFRPDYYIDQSSISFSPQNINAASDSFLIKVIVKNLGAVAVNNSGIINYIVNVTRIFPNGQIQNTSVNLPSAKNTDTVYVWIPSDRINGPGLNTFKIKVDYEDKIAEYSELNNEVTVTKLILADDIIPIFPYDFCIVNDANFELVFSTANNFASSKTYVFQIDTTELFNSPLLTSTKITAPGATIKWQPSITKIQNTVYYWRGTVDTIPNNAANWKNSSFLFNTSLSTGWNQSHYFQYSKNAFNTLQLKQDRMFYYPSTTRTLQVRNGMISDQLIETYFDGYIIARNAWERRGFIFFVYDGNTGKNWQTYQIGNTGRGPYNDRTSFRYPLNVIEFITSGGSPGNNYTAKQERKFLIDFLNSIPCNSYVLGYSFYNAAYNDWLNDSTSTTDATLFSAFERIGISQIRNQQPNVPFTFFTHTCDPSFNTLQIKRFPPAILDTLLTFGGTWTKGNMQSPLIGPARNWRDFNMDWTAKENPTFDNGNVDIYGYDTAGFRVRLTPDGGLSKGPSVNLNVDAVRYPFVQMEWQTSDDSLGTAPQMDHWRLFYDKAPEAVVNPTINFVKTRDTIVAGETFTMTVAVENVTPINMDSLLVKYIIKDASNRITIFYKRFGPLLAKQSMNIDFTYPFAGANFFGLNSVTIEVNPEDDQVEQFHFNNFATFNVSVLKDRINPLLDVTFDGRHIIDNEYVSANPEIIFRLKDENKFLALNDTAGFLIYLFYPNNPDIPVQIYRNQSDVTFIPADPNNLSKNNEARLIYKPTLADGIYEIRAQGVDRSKNDAGKYDYRIKFKVDSKPSITNILNYPNPFSTSTQFVFTLTGATIPEQLVIQIFSASGKVVKEITKEQLGTLHIGTNITDYKWDATDNFGDRLANGVYFFRVMTRNNDGSSTEIRQSSIDKFFKNGYGKLYIIH